MSEVGEEEGPDQERCEGANLLAGRVIVAAGIAAAVAEAFLKSYKIFNYVGISGPCIFCHKCITWKELCIRFLTLWVF